MKHLSLSIALMYGTTSAFAQFSPSGGGIAPDALSPSYLMPAGKIYVKTSTIRHRGVAHQTPRIALNGTPASIHDSPGGAFRISCEISHESFDDPIVWPGRPGMTHLHTFFGNTSTSSATDAADMRAVGDSTCAGGSINKTGYWTPTLIYHCPAAESGCDHNRDGNVIHANGNGVYYKSEGYTGPGTSTMQWFPPGLRQISGNPNATSMSAPGTGNIRIDCLTTRAVDDAGGVTSLGFMDHIPTTADVNVNGEGSCSSINLMVGFPVCWDGVNLDSPDHQSHMSDNADSSGCLDAGYTLLPSITYNVHFYVTSNADFDHIRLSSDHPKAEAQLHGVGSASPWACATAAKNWCAGPSLHGDWANGWITTPVNLATLGLGLTGMFDIVQGAIMGNCLNPQTYFNFGIPSWGLDCHVNVLGQLDRAGHPGVEYWLY